MDKKFKIQKEIIDKNRSAINDLQTQLRKTKMESNLNQSMSHSRAENTIFNLLNETVNNKKRDDLLVQSINNQSTVPDTLMSPKVLFSKFSTIDPKEMHYKTKQRCLSAHVHKSQTSRNQ